ncbi:MAG: hypothetical protein BWY22_02077 [Bacteroidetes bacterium ADurb.Bin217]|nr:MAG: hypothetical protein BWY22_02077 [Bacteroidetes bacterium ADurb.Bin217]
MYSPDTTRLARLPCVLGLGNVVPVKQPHPSLPQLHTYPVVASTAIPCESPADTIFIFERGVPSCLRTGINTSVLVAGRPNTKSAALYALPPHEYTVPTPSPITPSSTSAKTCSSPASRKITFVISTTGDVAVAFIFI